MATEQTCKQLPQDYLLAAVKEEPSEEQTFCYGTVTKEEVILVDECSGTRNDQRKHEGVHQEGMKESEQVKAVDGLQQKIDSSIESREKVIREKNIEKDESEESDQSKDENRFKCSECNRTYDEEEALKRCIYRHKVIKLERYKCKTCGKCFSSKYNLTTHEDYHKKQMKLSQSGEDFTRSEQSKPIEKITKADISEEEKSEGGEKCFKCSECNRMHRDQYTVKKCEKKHSAKRLGLYECKYCKMRAGTSGDLKRHELRHERKLELAAKPKSFTCDVCGKCFVTKDSFRNHTCSQHEEELRYTCHKCNLEFPTRPELASHIHRHRWDDTKNKYFVKLVKDEDGTYLCTICNRKYINQRTGKAHVFRHMNIIEGLFECKICGMKCGDSYDYKIHSQTHAKPEEVSKTSDGNHPLEETGGNPSKERDDTQKSTELDCKICRKRLRNKQFLERHEFVHRRKKRKMLTGKDAVEPEQGAEEVTTEGTLPAENSSSFCYETVVKEELIIEDDDGH